MCMTECLMSCWSSKSLLLSFKSAIGVCSVLSASTLGHVSSSDTIQNGFSIDDLVGYEESWIYVSVPEYGNFLLREVLEVGTRGWYAVESFGVPIEQYVPAYAFTTNPTRTNNGVVILIPEPHCLGDFNNDGVVNAADITLFTMAYIAGDLSADLTGNGILDIFDQILFIQLATMGCVNSY